MNRNPLHKQELSKINISDGVIDLEAYLSIPDSPVLLHIVGKGPPALKPKRSVLRVTSAFKSRIALARDLDPLCQFLHLRSRDNHILSIRMVVLLKKERERASAKSLSVC